jgi:hypothetical protein
MGVAGGGLMRSLNHALTHILKFQIRNVKDTNTRNKRIPTLRAQTVLKLSIKLGIIFILNALNVITPKLFFVNRYFIVEHVLFHCIFQC